MFLWFQFDLYRDAIHVSYGYISWLIIHEVLIQAHLRKVPKITYQLTQPGNNKESVSLKLVQQQQQKVVS